MRPYLAWLHIPLVLWGAVVEIVGFICPLTPLENRFRRLGGQAGYGGDFIEEYLLPVIYPAPLTRSHQILLGILVIAINLAIYALVIARARKKR